MNDSPASGTRSKARREAIARASFLFVGLAFGVLLAEAAVRGFTRFGTEAGRRIRARDPFAAIYEPFGNFGYRPTPGKIERFPNGTHAVYNAMGFRGPLVKLEKPAETYRIVFLGGSTAVGFGANDDETIDAHMRRMLHARYPGLCFEVVNLALGGYDSYQDYERMRVDGTRLSPDLVIIHSGINDVRNAGYPNLRQPPPDPRTLIWESVMARMRDEALHGTSLWTQAKHYSYLARVPGYVLELARQRQGLETIRTVEPQDDAVDYFQTNVSRTIELGRQSGAAILLSTPPSALSARNKPTDPVEKSYWIKDAGTTEAYRLRLEARMVEIAQKWSADGEPVHHVAHKLPPEQFLDDAHLRAAGNETVARNLAEAADPYVRAAAPATAVGQARCTTPERSEGNG